MTRSKGNTVVVSDPFAKRLMVRYLSHREDDLVSLRRALEQGDFENIRRKGHNLFGSGSAYGLDEISELGADLEKTAQTGDGRAIAALIESLETYVRSLRIV